MSNISRGNTDYVDFVHFAEAKCHLFRGNAGLFVCETVVLSVFRCKFHQNLYWLTIWWWLWWKISNISRGNTNYVDFYHFAEAQCHSFRGPAGLFVTAASARSRQVFLWDWDCDADGVSSCQCCQVLTSIYGHICRKPRPFSKLSRPPIKKFAPAWYFKAQLQYKKTQCLVRDFVIF